MIRQASPTRAPLAARGGSVPAGADRERDLRLSAPGGRDSAPGGIRPAQTRLGSLTEAAVNVTVGYLVALGTQALVFPLFGIRTSFSIDAAIAGIFTAVSIARSYLLRRLFERLLRRRASAPIGE